MAVVKHRPRPYFLRFKIIHWYLIPIISVLTWWGMLIAMLGWWGAMGNPDFRNTGHDNQRPVFLSDLGQTHLQPLFISCAGFQAIFFIGTLVMEFFLRKTGRLQQYLSDKQPIFALISIFFATVGQLGILFVSIFTETEYNSVHYGMVALFIVGCFLACCFNFMNSFVFGHYPQRLSPDHEKVIFGTSRWANLYMVSFWVKVFWLAAAVAIVFTFLAYLKIGNDGKAAAFEWTICFWYGFLLILWTLDLFPSAVKHYRRRFPNEFDNNFKTEDADEKVDDSHTISTFGAPMDHNVQPMLHTDTTYANARTYDVA